jgi:exodeoxyribonuclease V alpha subunit
LKKYRDAEQYICDKLRMLDSSCILVDESNLSRSIDICEVEENIKYAPMQRKAIERAVNSGVMVLTGGPGTGKTTVIRAVTKIFSRLGMKYALAAPTGRAAKRMSEATSEEAKTIHRLLEVAYTDGERQQFMRNRTNLLDENVIIIDEASMIDALLMAALLEAIRPGAKLLLIGDADQLPSVGAGNVLRDVIESGVFPVVRLPKIFRQAASSRIITNAHRINRGLMPDISNGKSTDFFFIEIEEPEMAAQEIVNLVKDRLPRSYKTRDIQVLTPMQRGVVGASNLNQVLQQAVNPDSHGIRRGGVEYREHDKVMQIRNNYDKEVFNGDIGTVISVNLEDRELVIRFDDREVAYDSTELDEVVLAYATTIHKSQGSEYPIVVMPVLMTHFVMLQRNLIYTGITRAKKILVIVGTKKALSLAVRNVTVDKRNTMLAERLNHTNG